MNIVNILSFVSSFGVCAALNLAPQPLQSVQLIRGNLPKHFTTVSHLGNCRPAAAVTRCFARRCSSTWSSPLSGPKVRVCMEEGYLPACSCEPGRHRLPNKSGGPAAAAGGSARPEQQLRGSAGQCTRPAPLLNPTTHEGRRPRGPAAARAARQQPRAATTRPSAAQPAAAGRRPPSGHGEGRAAGAHRSP